MIELTKFHGSRIIVNADLIEFIDSIPETVVVMSTGRRVIVTEQVQEVVEKVIEYRRRYLSAPHISPQHPQEDAGSPATG
jgi:flagellar protein FlbD